ncbi:hypothetical protein [Phenylobacterium sp.]|jgi:peptidoglycan/LPS O-acetylase OafA/YrhL|uniref:hypothetical protein n=1 Tax=Phenylobacterium sp. TaxID=1871053 RepID=UPI002E35EC67|nr:hypothetical protein [Phenylobacterium sp.]HEX2560073.1 hypothetical protein [Phenylobacterium sp.]
MPRVSLAFFTAAALCGMAGMIWGVVMASSEDFTLSPAHAHLNLVGWATLALMGIFYALAKAGGRLAWANFALSAGGVAVMVPSLALYLQGSKPATLGLQIGTVLVILGMLIFLVTVLSRWSKPAAA